MQAILRYMQGNRAQDYVLDRDQELKFPTITVFMHGGNALLVSNRPVWHEGKSVNRVGLKIGDMILVEEASRSAIMILPCHKENRRILRIGEELTIGRKEGNDLVLRDNAVSGQHCSFKRDGNCFLVQDKNSTNGTIVNGEIIRGRAVLLKEKDLIQVGSFAFSIEMGQIVELYSREGSTKTSAKRKYPYFVRTARTMEQVEEKVVEIEAAPNIGEKPSMKMAGIAMNWQMVALSMGFQGVRYLTGKRKYNKISQERDDLYNNYLNGIEEEVKEHIGRQMQSLARLHPSYAECMRIGEDYQPRLWERNPYDADFLEVRIGLGEVPAKVSFQLPRQTLKMVEDEYDHHPEELASKYKTLQGQPVTFDFLHNGHLGLAGARSYQLRMLQSLIIQLATLNCYTEVQMLLLCKREEVAEWDFVKWIPHFMDGGHNIRFFACSKEEARPILEEWGNILKQRMESLDEWKRGKENTQLPYLLAFVLDESLIEDTILQNAIYMDRTDLGVSAVFMNVDAMAFPRCVHWILQEKRDAWNLYQKEDMGNLSLVKPEIYTGEAEKLDYFARRLAPVRVRQSQGDVSMPSLISLLDGIHCSKVEDLNLLEMWQSAKPEKSLAVPIGRTASGNVFSFDIHEKGHGPHGVVAGMTGSGKTEMVQTWITMMALQYSPYDVNFVLVDFKGSGLIEPFRNLPHLAGTISNLDKDISRNLEALKSEMKRRMELLKVAKSDILRYQDMRKADKSLEPLPFLILIFDEFADFKRQYPEFISEIDTIFREGRSLGVYVVIMTQKPAGIITDQIRSNVNFRWCLKVQSGSDSKEIIDKPDAASILNPGRAYIKTSTNEKEVYELIQSFYSGVAYEAGEKKKDEKLGSISLVARNGLRQRFARKKEEKAGVTTQLTAVIRHIEKECEKYGIQKARQVWSEALPEYVALPTLLDKHFEENWGWNNPEYRSDPEREIYKGPVAVLGLVDNPAKQSTLTFEHDFWKDGNLAVYGANYSGKTTFLQTLVTSLAVRYTPAEVSFYLIDSGSYGMRSMEVFPHVGAAAGDDELEEVRQILALVKKEIEKRKTLFRAQGAGSPKAYEEATGEMLANWIVVADNLNLFLSQNMEFLNDFVYLSREGVSRGIYLACSFSGAMGINMQLQQNIKTVMSLSLNDSQDYFSIVGRVAKGAPPRPIGGGYVRGQFAPMLFQGALPLDEKADGKRTRFLREMAAKMQEAFGGDTPEGLKTMPEEISFGSIDYDGIALGLDYEQNPVGLDIDARQGLLISYGEKEDADTVIGSLLAQTAQKREGSRLYVCGGEEWSSRKSAQLPYEWIPYSSLDNRVEEFTMLLRERIAKRKAGETEPFEPLVIVVDGLKACKENCQKNTILRLESYVNLGAGLNVYVVISEEAGRLYDALIGGDLLVGTLRKKAAMLMTGGEVRGHKALNPITIPNIDAMPENMVKSEGYLFSDEWTRVKIMRYEYE